MSTPARKISSSGKTVRNPRTGVSKNKTRSGTGKKRPSARKITSSRSFGVLITCLISFIVFLSAIVIYMDQRAMRKGHTGLWETLAGITPAVSENDVSRAVERIVGRTGNITLKSQDRAFVANSAYTDIRHTVFSVSDESTFEQIIAEFDRNARREGLVIHNRHSIRNPGEWLQTYYVGTHASVIYKLDFVYYPQLLPDPPASDIPVHETEKTVSTTPAKSPRIALIFDDFGPNKAIANRFLKELTVPVTLAVIPWQPFSNEIISMTLRAKQTAFLHAPMEPHNPDAMGNLADQYLLTWMDEQTLLDRTVSMLNEHPGIAGVNNHTGSKMTEDRKAMRIFLSEIKKRGLIFVDSRTTSNSVAEEIARSLGIPTGSRHVFLDQGYDGGDVRANMHQLAEIARRDGYAIGIGHAIDSTLDQVINTLPEITSEGIEVVPIHALVN